MIAASDLANRDRWTNSENAQNPGSDFQSDMDASRAAGDLLIYLTPEERSAMRRR